ncbi:MULTISPECIES: hypothetical protein [Paenibacillus]|uniref:hypothetical protein n=1 Tax=Paenibacillus TaxID=44249 RepID=UPI00061F9B2F|nr:MULTISPECIES: hypothetical protein [Paenibacillus]KKC49436.1 hypothetical protein VE23_24055 [Paenibacillus sp. D9]
MELPNDKEWMELEKELREPLSSLTVRPVTAQDTTRLLAALQPAFDGLKPALGGGSAADWRAEASSAHKRPSLAKLLRTQLSAYSRAYWLASLGVFLMLLYVLPAGMEEEGWSGLTDISSKLSLFLPMMFLSGLLYSFRSWNKEMRTVESITPYPPALLLMARVMIVGGLNVLFGIAASLYMATRMDSFPVLPFMLQWMSLILLIAGGASYVMLRAGVKMAFVMGSVFWMAWNVMEYALRSPVSGQAAPDAIRNAIYWSCLGAGALMTLLSYRRSLVIKRVV